MFKHLIYWEIALYPHFYAAARDAEFARPFCQCSSYSLVGNQMIVSFVVSLLKAISPPAIIWRIVSIIVNALNRMTRRWSLPHVGVKILEGIDPAVAHGYTTTAVSWICRNVRVCTSRFYVRPTSVLRRLYHAVGCVYSARFFSNKTSTASSMPASQMAAGSDYSTSTFADTVPFCASAFIAMRIRYYGQSAKALASNIFDLLPRQWSVVNCCHVRYDNIFGQAMQGQQDAA